MKCCGQTVIQGTIGQYCSSCGAQYYNWSGAVVSIFMLITGTAMLLASTACKAEMQHEPEVVQTAEDIPARCASRLLGLAGSKAKLPHFEYDDIEQATYILAVMYVESKFNTKAHSSANAKGLMQVTPIAAEAASSFCKIKLGGDLFNPTTNVRIGACYLAKMREISADWTSTLILYNGGFRQLKAYDEGRSIASETANYVLKVEKARAFCVQPF
jgi:soluble lytic murein transglycosylase-like protein